MRHTLTDLLAGTVALLATAATPLQAPQVPRDADGFRHAVAPYAFAFPRDHASHPEFRTEWWYYTGHLEEAGASGTGGRETAAGTPVAGGRRFGYELTFFRVGIAGPNAPVPEGARSAWRQRDVMFVHLALTDATGRRFHYHEAARRPALGVAGADSTRYAVWLERSYARLAPGGRDHELYGEAPEFAFGLTLEPGKPPVVHGEGGVSRKAAETGMASHYYSLTRMPTRGRLRVGDDTLQVVGESWMDHEFGSGRMSGTHAGWDWFALQLDDGRELMLYQLRRRDGSIEPFSAGTLVDRDGRSRHLPREVFRVAATSRWTSPRTRAVYPSGWTIELPGESLSLTVTPELADQELTATAMGGVVYWEGAVRVRGTQRGRALTGKGYVELTGYTGRAPF
ncbi:MAG: lipocalin family protein [Candidatus Eisenbacteria bacterium]